MHFNHEPMSEAFDKWHVDGLPIAAVIHRFSEPDFGDPHDHPWGFRSVILAGGYIEQVFQLDGSTELETHVPGDSFTIGASHIHRIVDLIDGECWTMIMPRAHQKEHQASTSSAVTVPTIVFGTRLTSNA